MNEVGSWRQCFEKEFQMREFEPEEAKWSPFFPAEAFSEAMIWA